MFWILIALATVAFVFAMKSSHGGPTLIAMAVGVIILSGAIITPQGHLYWEQLRATTLEADWLLIERGENGQAVNHWIVRNGYVKSTGHGWQFVCGNQLHAVGPTTTVIELEESWDNESAVGYRDTYNIPTTQTALGCAQ